MRSIHLLAALLALAAAAEAGLVMTSEYVPSDNTSEKAATTSSIDRDRVRMETTEGQRRQVMIYRGDRQLVWLVDPRQKTYTELTKADLAAMEQSLSDAMKDVEEQLKGLPPDQRQSVEAMMKGKGVQPDARVAYQKAGAKVKVNRWLCQKYLGTRSGQKVQELWAASQLELGVSTEDVAVLEDLAEYFKGFAKMAPDYLNPPSETDGLNGIPVKTVFYSGSQIQGTMELKEVKRASLAPSLFDLPEGYKKEPLPAMPGGR